MATTSKVVVETIIKGLPEGGSARSRYEMTNSTGVRIAEETTFGTGISSATSWTTPVSAKYMILIPPTTNTNPWRIANSTSEVGLALSSQGPQVYALRDTTGGTEFFAYTTSTRAISGMRRLYG